jgi:hypothetical protein
MFKYLVFILIFFFNTNLLFADNTKFLISKIKYGGDKAQDEYVEIYNPSNKVLDINNYYFHIRNSSGKQDSAKNLTCKNSLIPPYSFFLLAGKDGVYKEKADCLYSSSLTKNSIIYFSKTREDLKEIIDYFSWGEIVFPENHHLEHYPYFDKSETLVRFTHKDSIIGGYAPSFDSDKNDFLAKTNITPKNSFSNTSYPYDLQIFPCLLSNIQAETFSNKIKIFWDTPDNDCFKQIFIKKKEEDPKITLKNQIEFNKLKSDTEYLFSFWLKKSDLTESFKFKRLFKTKKIIDKTPPQKLENLKFETFYNKIKISWDEIKETDFLKTIIKFKDKTLETDKNFVELNNLKADTVYQINLQNLDQSNNFSEVQVFSQKTKPCPFDGILKISEIFADPKNPWIELYNNSNNFLNLDGFSLVIDNKTYNLKGLSIPQKSLIVLDKKNFSKLAINKKTSLKIITPCLTEEEFTEIYKNKEFHSLERLPNFLNSNLKSSWILGKKNGSPLSLIPNCQNYFQVKNFKISPNIPDTLKDFSVTGELFNLLNSEKLNLELKLKFNAETFKIFSQENLFKTNLKAPLNQTYELKIIDPLCSYNNFKTEIEVYPTLKITEVYPKVRENESAWVELYNPYDVKFSLDSLNLKSKTKTLKLRGVIPEFTYQTIKIPSDFLSSYSDKLKLIKQENTVWDQMSYQYARYDYSFSKRKEIFVRTAHKTPNKPNDYNTSPQAKITLQGDKKTSGSIPFKINLTGEDSYDLDGDNLEYFWDYGGIFSSNKKNPLEKTFKILGKHKISLTVKDNYGGESFDMIEITTYKPPKPDFPAPDPSNLILNQKKSPFFISKVSPNSKPDYLEISCFECEKEKDLSRHYLYDGKYFFQFKNNTFLKGDQTFKLILGDFFYPQKDKNVLQIKHSGFSKTDDLVLLLDEDYNLIDSVCWNNYDQTLSKKLKKTFNNLDYLGIICLNSKDFNKLKYLRQTKNTWQKVFQSKKTSKKKTSQTNLVEKKEEEETKKNKDILKETKTKLKEKVIPIITSNNINTKTDFTKKNLSGLEIIAFLPNPEGRDFDQEWIQIKNTNNLSLNLKNWSVNNDKQEYFFEEKNLAPQETLKIFRYTSHFILKNQANCLFLKNPQGKISQKVCYPKADPKKIYKKNSLGFFSFSKDTTKQSLKPIIKKLSKKKTEKKDLPKLPNLNKIYPQNEEIFPKNRPEKIEKGKKSFTFFRFFYIGLILSVLITVYQKRNRPK